MPAVKQHVMPKCGTCGHKTRWCREIDGYEGDRTWWCDECGNHCDNNVGFRHCNSEGDGRCWAFVCHKCHKKKYKGLPDTAMKVLAGRGEADDDVKKGKKGDEGGKSGKRKKKKSAPRLPALPVEVAEVGAAPLGAKASLQALAAVLAEAEEATRGPAWLVVRAACRRAQVIVTDTAAPPEAAVAAA